jgi:hypothetical protein
LDIEKSQNQVGLPKEGHAACAQYCFPKRAQCPLQGNLSGLIGKLTQIHCVEHSINKTLAIKL